MTPVEEAIRELIRQRDWARLFGECLHWNLSDERERTVTQTNNSYRVESIAHLAGVKVFGIVPLEQSATQKSVRQRLAEQIEQIARHHLILFATRRVVYLVMRDGGGYYETSLTPDAPSVAQVSSLGLLRFPVQEEPTLDAVLGKLKQMFYKRQPERGEMMDAVQHALIQLEIAIQRTKQNAGTRAQQAFERGSAQELEQLTEVKKQIDDFERKVQILASEWEALAKQHPDLPVPTESPAPETPARSSKKRSHERQPRPASPARNHIPYREYQLAILEVIEQAGGTASRQQILDWVERKFGRRFTGWHREKLKWGDTRWKNQVGWGIQTLRQKGYLSSGYDRAYYTITDAGREWLNLQRGERSQG